MITKNELKEIKLLNQKKFRDIEKKFIIEGVHLMQEALKEDISFELVLYTQEFIDKNREIIYQLNQKKVRVEIISGKQIESISDTVTSQGIFGILKQPEYNIEELLKQSEKKPGFTILALDEISDPGNLGTIIRTADWFGADAILLSENCVDVFNPKVIRACMGSIFHLPVLGNINLEKLIDKIKESDFTVYGTILDGKYYRDISYSKKSLIILGNESRGLKETLQKKSDYLISIPKKGKAESLNVAIAAGIILEAKQ
jgi:RNA methyltransferase, TrmH family